MMVTVEQTRRLTKTRWLILLVNCLINLCIGSMYTWSSLSAPMAAELNADLSVVFSTANAVGFITMIVGGILNDRYGPRWVMFSGGIMFGVGMFLSGFAQSVFHLVLSYGLCLGLGLSMVNCCTISNPIKFFPDRRGMAGGMTTACYGISSVIFVPLAAWLCDLVGHRRTFMILGAVFLAVICAGAFVARKCPDGFVPEGYVPPAGTTIKGNTDKKPGEMLKMPLFYVMLMMLTCGAVFGLMIISNAKGLALALTGMSTAAATLFVSVLCLFNTAGRLTAGILSDRFGRIRTLTAALILAMVGLGVLYGCGLTGSVALFTLGVILIGVCFGTFMGVFPGFCTDQFGSRYNTVNYGIMWIGFSAAGIIGPLILSGAFHATGTYQWAFIIAMVMAAAGLGLIVLCRMMVKQNKE